MIRLIQRRLIVPRGDTGTFSIPVLAGKNTGDVAIFTIFNQLTHKKIFEKVMELSGEALTMELSHGDTVNLPVGQFVWDIKFYSNPTFADERLVDGEEVDSYYAAFTLPVCEIRETGDNLLFSDEAPQATLSPGQIDYITASINEVTNSKNAAAGSAAEADVSATNAGLSASAASASESAAAASESAALAAQQAAQQAAQEAANAARALIDDTATTGDTDKVWSADKLTTTVSGIEQDIYQTAVSLSNEIDAVANYAQTKYTKPANGIPASDLEETYLTQHQDLSNYVQKTDYATAEQAGVIKPGVGMSTFPDGTIRISPISDDKIKNASSNVYAINPMVQHKSVFYGLAKAAGDKTQSQSNNAVGTYTNSAKTAIQNMLGVPSTSAVTSEIAAAIGNINSFDMAVVQELPSQDISTHTIYLVPKTGDTNDVYDEYIYINNGWEMIGNTQIDLSNYVQKTDYATSSAAGVVKVRPLYGVNINSSGYLTFAQASDEMLKAGTTSLNPIAPSGEHIATFYGLAKAAGDTTQSQSNNAVGTYTTEAKAAIQTMLDVPSNADLILKADKIDTVLETTLSRGRKENTTVGGASLAFGINTEASGYYSVALGLNTTASSQGAFAEGKNTVAHYIAHAEGEDSQALGSWSHAQNLDTIANGGASSASGRHTIANGADSFVIGKYNAVDSYDNWPIWTANTSYEVGDRIKRNLMVQNEPTDVGYHCTVANNDATFDNAHWELDGYHMNYVEIVGNGKEYEDPETHQTIRAGSNAYALEWNGTGHFAGDVYVNANANSSGGTKVATVTDVSAKADKADTILDTTLSRGRKANTTVGEGSFAFGNNVEASGNYAHAEGNSTVASGIGSHVEGTLTTASGMYTHSEGVLSIASGMAAHSEGLQVTASGQASHAEGQGTIASQNVQHVLGKYNIEDTTVQETFLGHYIEIVGNGVDNSRSNAYALDWDGTGYYNGDIYVGCNNDSTGGTKVATVAELATKLDAAEAGLKVVRLI